MSWAGTRIGHGGAGRLAPHNTLAAFDVACQAGVDMIEFDVLRVGSRVVAAHTLKDALLRRRSCLSLLSVAAHLSQPQFSRMRFNVDVKRPGYEQQVLDLLDAFGLLDRCLFSSQFPRALDRIRQLHPKARVGLSVGCRWSRLRHHTGRRKLNRWLERHVAEGRWQALMIHHRWITEDRAQRLRDLGAELYAWTVDDASDALRLMALPVTGISTNNPGIFADA